MKKGNIFKDMIKESSKKTSFTKKEISERVSYGFNNSKENNKDRESLEREIKHLAKK